MQKQIVESKLLEYLKLKNIKITKRGPTLIIDCPICNAEQRCIKIPNVNKFNCHVCQKRYDIFDFAKKLETEYPNNEKEQLHYMKELLNLNIVTSIDKEYTEKLLEFYEKNNWDLLPVTRLSKVPFKGHEWTTKEHKNISEWRRWVVEDSLNLGVKTGFLSNLLVIDLDVLSTPEKNEIRKGTADIKRRKELLDKRKANLEIIYEEIKDVMGEPLIHETLGGSHLMYEYDKEIPKTFIKIKDMHVDIEAEGGYILIAPSKLENDSFRKFKEFKSPPKMSIKFKEFLKSKMDNTNTKVIGDEIKDAIENENFKINPEDFELKNNGLEGCCNSSFTKLGGIFRKQLNIKQTGYVLHTLNKHLLKRPMQPKVINDMVRQLDKYVKFDETALANEIVSHLRSAGDANKTEIAMAIVGTNRGEDKKRVDNVLGYLVKEEIIVKKGTYYSAINSMIWSGKLLDVGIPVNFKVPFFNELFNFNKEDLILIASRTKYGKTTLAMNFVKKLIDQGVAVDYIYNETGGRYAKTALKLGMKDDDFESAFATDPSKIILRKDKVTIFDWVKPTDFARTDNVYSDLVEKVKKSKGFLICFAQLRENDTFFAGDQIGQFPALISRYMYEDESGENTKFVIDQARDSKIKGKKWEIPCKYDWDSKIVHTIEELQSKDEIKPIDEKEQF